jgi:uncharacterized membrane protein (UPF0127 family)
MVKKSLTRIIVLSLTLLLSCTQDKDPFPDLRKANLLLGNGKVLPVTLAITREEQHKGLSGIRDHEFPAEAGMFFFYGEDGPRHFGMPDTYFDLDIFYISADMKVIAVVRNLPAHPGRGRKPPIPRAGVYTARHVLELKSTSQVSQMIHVGDHLIWEDLSIPLRLESTIH